MYLSFSLFIFPHSVWSVLFRGKYSSSSKRVMAKRIRLLQYPAPENNTSESRFVAAQAVLPWRICKRKSLTWVTGSASRRPPNTLALSAIASRPRSMSVPNEIDLLSTRVDSYRHPIDTKSIPYRHPKILVLTPAATAQNRKRIDAYRRG